MLKQFISFVIIGVTVSVSQAERILIDESADSKSYFTANKWNSSKSVKSFKKMGLGTTFSGAMGLAGANLDLNFSKDFTFSLGLGISHHFHSFNMHIQQTLGGETFLPYVVAGYSRWTSMGQNGSIDSTSPSLLGDKFLNSTEKRTGIFSKDLIYPGIGLEYLNNSGDWSGLAFFGELLLLVDVSELKIATTAGLGVKFYF